MPENESKLSIDERQVGDVVVVSLKGEITLDDGDLKFGRWIDALLKKGQRKILVDLAGVTYIDSAGVGMMVFEFIQLFPAGAVFVQSKKHVTLFNPERELRRLQ